MRALEEMIGPLWGLLTGWAQFVVSCCSAQCDWLEEVGIHGDFADEVAFSLSEMIEGLLECWPLDVIVVLDIPVEFFF